MSYYGGSPGGYGQGSNTFSPVSVDGLPRTLDVNHFSGSLGNIAGYNSSSDDENTPPVPPLQEPRLDHLVEHFKQQQQHRLISKQHYRPVKNPQPPKLGVGAPPASKRKKTKAKRPSQTAEITPRPASEQVHFAQFRAIRQQLREKTLPLSQQDPNIMAKTRSKQQPQEEQAPAPDDPASDAEAESNRKNSQAKSPRQYIMYQGKPAKMPKTMGELQKKFVRVLEELEEVYKERDEAVMHGKHLAKTLQEITTSAPKLAKNKKVVEKIGELIKMNLFRTLKFLGDETHILKNLTTLYDLIYTKEEQAEVGKDHKVIWQSTYKGVLTAELNSHRSYVQNRMKESWRKFHETNKWLPTMEQIKKCALRTIDMKDDGEVLVMEWYFMDLLSKCRVILAILPTIVLPD